MIFFRLGGVGYFAYYSLAVCPPESWDTGSLARFIFLLLGLQATLYWDFVMAYAFVNYYPFSIECKTSLSKTQYILQALYAFLFMAGLDPIVVPQALECSAQVGLHYKLIGSLLIINIIGALEQFYAIILQFTWINDLIYNCNAVLSKKMPSLEEIKETLDQYELLRFSVQGFMLLIYTPLQVFTIFAFFVGIGGNIKISLKKCVIIRYVLYKIYIYFFL